MRVTSSRLATFMTVNAIIFGQIELLVTRTKQASIKLW